MNIKETRKIEQTGKGKFKAKEKEETNFKINSIINAMAKYDHRQHELSDWLLELEQRFQLGDVETDQAKIIWCQLLIGATGNSILAGLDAETTWETAKETLLSRLGAGSVRYEAWAALKHLTRGTKEIIELASEAEKFAKRLHPRDAEAVERHAVDAFLGALDHPLAAEVRKLGHTQMEGVVADTRRIEKILQEQPPSGEESALESMNRQIQILKKDLLKAKERLAAPTPATPPTVSLAIPATPTVAAAQPPPASLAAQQLPPAAAPLPPPMATARVPQSRQEYQQQYYRNEDPQYFRRQDRRQDRWSVRCFLCDEEGHFAYRCPARALLQRLLRQHAQEQVRRPLPSGQVLELPPADGHSQAPPQSI